MARFWPGTSGGTVIAAPTKTATQFRVTIDLDGGTTYDIFFTGSGFTYSSDTATGGTYTSIQLRATGSASAIVSLTGLAAQPITGIYTMSLANLTPLAGNDTITGNTNAASNDVLYGGDGNDTISDTGGAINIDAGDGDDKITIGTTTTGRTGTIVGGLGTDILHTSKDISGVTLSGVEILEANSGAVTGKAAQFGSFDIIRISATQPTVAVSLIFAATGVATTTDLSGALNSGGGPRRVTITGSADDETITTGEAIALVSAGGGNDVITGGLGADQLRGEDGNDTLNGGEGDDFLIGGAGNNTYNGGIGNDSIVSDGGSNKTETMNGDAGEDKFLIQAGTGATSGAINGGDDNDTIEFRRSFSGTVNGGQGTDTVKAFGADLSGVTNAGFEHFDGTATAKLAFFTAFQTITGSVTLAASGFATVFDFAARGASSVVGSSDNETLTATGTVSGGGGNDILTGTITLLGGDGNDTLNAGTGQDYLDGGTGNDKLNGNGDNDNLVDSVGNDSLNGGDGNDRLEAIGGNDTLNGGTGNDTLLAGGGGPITISGSDGLDLVVIRDGTFTGSINSGNGEFDALRVNEPVAGLSEDPSDDIRGLVITNVEELQVSTRVIARAAQLEGFDEIRHFMNTGRVKLVIGTSGGPTVIDLRDEVASSNVVGLELYGSADNETIFGTGFADLLSGGLGNDVLRGGGGNDTLTGGAGNDVFALEDDTASVSDSSGIDTITSTITRSLTGFSTIENLTLLSGNINGTGNALANRLTGSSGNNILNGSTGNDTISGGAGTDKLFGGTGNDSMTGGTGSDTFVFNTALNASSNRDIITDFSNSGQNDVMHLENTGSGLFNKLAAGALNSKFFKANATGTATDSDDRIIYNTKTGALFYDSNGNASGGATQFATLSTKPTLTASDFFVI